MYPRSPRSSQAAKFPPDSSSFSLSSLRSPLVALPAAALRLISEPPGRFTVGAFHSGVGPQWMEGFARFPAGSSPAHVGPDAARVSDSSSASMSPFLPSLQAAYALCSAAMRAARACGVSCLAATPTSLFAAPLNWARSSQRPSWTSLLCSSFGWTRPLPHSPRCSHLPSCLFASRRTCPSGPTSARGNPSSSCWKLARSSHTPARVESSFRGPIGAWPWGPATGSSLRVGACAHPARLCHRPSSHTPSLHLPSWTPRSCRRYAPRSQLSRPMC